MGERSGLYVGPDGDEDLYELVLILGGGGQGQVWKAQMRPDRDSHAVVTYAVKVIEPADDDEAEIDWIRRAKSLWNLDHPGLVRMFEPFVGAPMHYAGCTTGRTGERVRYLVMDLVDGLPLNEWIEDNQAATLSQRIGTLRMIAAALDMMHMPSKASGRSPVAHGDIKPSNILVQPSGASKLVDFGLARVVGARGVPGVGSLPFLAPELLTSSDGLPTPDSDRFSFAATLFTVLTGTLPPRSPDRGPDLDRTRAMLAATPLVSTREGLLEQVMEGLGEPAGRPRGLATWLEGFRTQTMTTPSIFPAGPTDTGPASPTLASPAAATSARATSARATSARTPRRGRVLIGAVSAVALLVGGGGALALARSDTGGQGTIARGAPVAAPARTTTAAGSMPNVVGSPVASATTQLTQSRLPPPTVLEEIDPRATDGQILSQSPAAGTPHPKTIVLVVARAPVVSYLQDLSAVNNDPDLGPRSVAGHAYPHSIYSTLATCDKRATFEYNLGKHYRQLLATAGLDDSSLYSGGKILFEAFLDSRPVFAKTIGLGQAVPVRVSAQGALRLKLRLTYVGPRPRHCLDEIAVWGDARLLGVPSEVPTPDPNAA